MKMLITKEQVDLLGCRDSVPCECLQCKKSFSIPKNVALRAIKGTRKADYCSKDCSSINQKGENVVLVCLHCNKEFTRTAKIHRRWLAKGCKNTFCSKICSYTYSNNLRRDTRKRFFCACGKEVFKGTKRYCKECYNRQQSITHYNRIVKAWKLGEYKGWYGKTYQFSRPLRRYLFEKYSSKCCRCGWSEKHPITNVIPLEVNHIDGDASNCKEENLELLCPNCHSLTPNFRSLNKNSCRQRKSD